MSDESFLSRWSQKKAAGKTDAKSATKSRLKGPALRAFSPAMPDALDEMAKGASNRAWRKKGGVEEESQEAALKEDLFEGQEREGGEVVGETADDDAAGQSVREEDLPDIETLDYDSDYSAFLAEGVSDSLRNRALSRLWRSNPVFANLDGLNDYDEDFRTAQLLAGEVKSAYDAVKGFLSEEEHEEKAPESEVAKSESPGEGEDAEQCEEASHEAAKPCDGEENGEGEVASSKDTRSGEG